MAEKLTTKQLKFIEAYAGNGTEAARLAGYKGNDKTLSSVAVENLAKPIIAHAIKEREQKAVNKLIATREERQQFWTKYMREEGLDIAERFKASELLGKSEADFINKVEVEHSNKPQTLEEIDKRLQELGVKIK